MEIDYRVKAGSRRRRRRSARRRRRRHGAAARRQDRRGVRDSRAVDHRLLLRRGRPRALPRRLAAHRRHRRPGRGGLHDDQRPLEGRHQVGRRVDQLGRPGGHADGPPGGLRSGGHRGARRYVGRNGRCVAWCCARARPPAPKSCRSSSPSRVAKWWLPERWAFIETVPKTSVGKFDKKVLRAQYAEDDLPFETLE